LRREGWSVRILFVLLSALIGYGIGGDYRFALTGLLLSGALAVVDGLTRREWLKGLFISSIGMSVGLAGAALILHLIKTSSQTDNPYLNVALPVILGYAGAMTAYRYRGLIPSLKVAKNPGAAESSYKILDTSVIIDGRIVDICKTQFIEGTLLIPRFVLRELQHIADSLDVLRRNKGRRGLDKLRELQELPDIDVQVIDEDYPDIQEVDAKLIRLARELNAKIITNDFNLNKVAELQGVTVLNINDLANALKPIVLPGETMTIKIIKEGKEFNQGVGYLDDGTMVVVENGRQFLGQTVLVEVTSTLQTAAGRMIFTRIKEEPKEQQREGQQEEQQPHGQRERERRGGFRPHPRGWSRGEDGRG